MKYNHFFSIALFALFSFSSLPIKGKDIFDPGYIVTVEKDTINGYILNQVDSDLSTQIEFKTDLFDRQSRVYTTSDLISFGFSGGRTFDRLSPEEYGGSDSTYVFAKRWIKGKINAWLHRLPKRGFDLFLINRETKNSAHLKPPQKDQVTDLNGKRHLKKDSYYLGLLRHVMLDSLFISAQKRAPRYFEKGLRKNLMEYNNYFAAAIPAKHYQEHIEISLEITGGLPVNYPSDATSFRVGIYRNKKLTEKSKRLSSLRGITYFHYASNEDWDQSIEEGYSMYKWQAVSILPAGIKYQGLGRILQPYVYAGIGLGLVIIAEHKIVDYEIAGNEVSFMPFPTINIGAGTKIKVGSKYLLAEITPYLNGVMISAGVSF